MKEKFIKFLKQNHTFDEYKKEILPYSLEDLNPQFKDGGAEFLLNDGCVFYWSLASTGVNWKEINAKWVSLLKGGE